MVGGLLATKFNPIHTIDTVVNDGFISAVSGSAGIFIFLVLLGIIVALLNKAGGSQAFGRWAAKHVKSKFGAAMATFLFGVLIFIDDYFNCLTVGSVMRPFTDRQKIDETYNYLGGYVQGGYFVAPRLQAALRYDFFNRNGLDTDGFLNMPAIGFNYFFKGCNLKLQAMYQYIGRTGHETQLDRDNDNLGLATHTGVVQLQYSF